MTLDGNAVRSVDRAAALLLALGESHGEAGVTELARRLGLHKSTASRLLATLEKRGLVEQDEESGKYRLGLVVIRLAEPRRADARPALDRDARAGPARPRDARDHRPRRARRRPAAHRGPGRRPQPRRGRRLDGPLRPAPLASRAARSCSPSLPEREILRLVRRGLDRFTDRTITDLEPLLEELARVRRRGYATAFGEYDAGLNAIAAPGPRRARPGHRRGRRLGPGVPGHAAPRAGARAAGPRGRRRDLRPPRGDAPPRLARPPRGLGSTTLGRDAPDRRRTSRTSSSTGVRDPIGCRSS